MISPIFTSDGQATSQRLQLSNISALRHTVRHLSDADARHRPGLFWPWIAGIHPAHRAGGVQTVHLMQFSKLVSFIVGLRALGNLLSGM